MQYLKKRSMWKLGHNETVDLACKVETATISNISSFRQSPDKEEKV
jgi:hypothetical protein